MNKLIDQTILATGAMIPIKKIVGDYSPGYIYGNVKTHKEGAKLRPIISHVTTPTYRTAKEIDSIIKRYLPQGKMLKSSTEFVELLSGHEYSGNLYSLDVESLFTNVPVHRTIIIILETGSGGVSCGTWQRGYQKLTSDRRFGISNSLERQGSENRL